MIALAFELQAVRLCENRADLVLVEIADLHYRCLFGGYSVYARAGNVDNLGAELPKLIAKKEAPLTWREAAKFVRTHGSAKIHPGARVEIEAHGVKTWQKDAIVHAMHPHWKTDQFLRSQPDRDLKLLHDTLGGLLSEESRRILLRLRYAACRGPLLHKSVSKIAMIVGAATPIDAERFLEDIWAYQTYEHCQRMLAQHGAAGPIPAKEFLMLLDRPPLRSAEMRSRLMELWLRTEPKPVGRPICGLTVDDEFGVLHWRAERASRRGVRGVDRPPPRGLGKFCHLACRKSPAFR